MKTQSKIIIIIPKNQARLPRQTKLSQRKIFMDPRMTSRFESNLHFRWLKVILNYHIKLYLIRLKVLLFALTYILDEKVYTGKYRII